MAGVVGAGVAGGVVAGAGPISAAALHAVLLHTFTPEAGTRKAAEAQLESFCQAPECLMLLLQIVVEPQVDRDVRQAAAIALKNTVRGKWLPNPELNMPSTFPPEHKATFRTNILEALLRETDKSIRDILAETLKIVASYDFPDDWPALVPTIVAQLQTGEVLRVHNAMLALRKVVKRYEYKPKDARAPLLAVMRVTLPLLLGMCHQLVGDDSAEAGQVLKIALKVFWSCTQFAIPSGEDLEALNVPSWMDLCSKVLAKPLAGQPETDDEREVWPWWKAKKWACNIAQRFFTRYGQPHYAEENMTDFAEAFSKQLAPKLLEQDLATSKTPPLVAMVMVVVVLFCCVGWVVPRNTHGCPTENNTSTQRQQQQQQQLAAGHSTSAHKLTIAAYILLSRVPSDSCTVFLVCLGFIFIALL